MSEDTRAAGVYLAYSLIIWVITPLLFERLNINDRKMTAFSVGYIVSLLLYANVGKNYIETGNMGYLS